MPKYQLINSTLELWSNEYIGPKFHAVFCDPPYDLGFMGKAWDKAADYYAWGTAILPHLYPGALCFMFGGTRTWHRLAIGMEEAGFQIWDTLMWLHGQGFPKGQDISKLIDKRNGDDREIVGKDKWFASASNTRDKYNGFSGEDTRDITAPGSPQSAPWTGHKTPALKPAWEPVLAFRVPLDGTYAGVALEHGTGALNIDGARIGTSKDVPASPSQHTDTRCHGKFGAENGKADGFNPNLGRYPANLLLDDESAALLDEQTGTLTSGALDRSKITAENKIYGRIKEKHGRYEADSGGASRFFYCAKASTGERNAGLDALPDKPFGMSNQAKAEIKRGTDDFENSGLGVNTVKLVKNNHPTVKPIALTEYLAKLLLPPQMSVPRRLLVPFSGSGSEIIGALKAGWDEVVGIEQDMEQGYCQIAEARIKHWITS